MPKAKFRRLPFLEQFSREAAKYTEIAKSAGAEPADSAIEIREENEKEEDIECFAFVLVSIS